VEDYVIPLVQAFGAEVVHGKAVFGGALPDEILKAIRSSDAMIGFTTRREQVTPGQFSTHAWVVQELVTAHSQTPQIPWVEVREQGVISPGGIVEAANAQRIEYQETDRARCFVEIAKALGRFREETSVITVRLGPASAVEQISTFLDDASFIADAESCAMASNRNRGSFRSSRCAGASSSNCAELRSASW